LIFPEHSHLLTDIFFQFKFLRYIKVLNYVLLTLASDLHFSNNKKTLAKNKPVKSTDYKTRLADATLTEA
jgi:hypothetical protein